jgi:hypothetical protein
MISFFLALLLPVDLLLHLRLPSMASPPACSRLVNHMRDKHKKEEGEPPPDIEYISKAPFFQQMWRMTMTAQKVTFDTDLIRPDAPGTWTYLKVPLDVEAIYGSKSRIPVQGTVDGSPFRSSLMPQGVECLS